MIARGGRPAPAIMEQAPPPKIQSKLTDSQIEKELNELSEEQKAGLKLERDTESIQNFEDRFGERALKSIPTILGNIATARTSNVGGRLTATQLNNFITQMENVDIRYNKGYSEMSQRSQQILKPEKDKLIQQISAEIQKLKVELRNVNASPPPPDATVPEDSPATLPPGRIPDIGPMPPKPSPPKPKPDEPLLRPASKDEMKAKEEKAKEEKAEEVDAETEAKNKSQKQKARTNLMDWVRGEKMTKGRNNWGEKLQGDMKILGATSDEIEAVTELNTKPQKRQRIRFFLAKPDDRCKGDGRRAGVCVPDARPNEIVPEDSPATLPPGRIPDIGPMPPKPIPMPSRRPLDKQPTKPKPKPPPSTPMPTKPKPKPPPSTPIPIPTKPKPKPFTLPTKPPTPSRFFPDIPTTITQEGNLSGGSMPIPFTPAPAPPVNPPKSKAMKSGRNVPGREQIDPQQAYSRFTKPDGGPKPKPDKSSTIPTIINTTNWNNYYALFKKYRDDKSVTVNAPPGNSRDEKVPERKPYILYPKTLEEYRKEVIRYKGADDVTIQRPMNPGVAPIDSTNMESDWQEDAGKALNKFINPFETGTRP